MISGYIVNNETKESTVIYNEVSYVIAPNWLDGELSPVKEIHCEDVVLGMIEGNKALAKNAINELEYDANQYQRDRATAYPSLTEQADMAYWDRQNGTTTLDDAISAVKLQFPKI